MKGFKWISKRSLRVKFSAIFFIIGLVFGVLNETNWRRRYNWDNNEK
ncbi:hypothetical protein LCGC14_2031340 [marine sediment metagenome]|uniref:Uncharacterized protein n=1 Tax=marine sediment metagenome TaxID=412755 RepID=A0A0F9H829_9ZZZZ